MVFVLLPLPALCLGWAAALAGLMLLGEIVDGTAGPDALEWGDVTGWEILREGGGANQIHGRERVPGTVRHVRCLPANVQDEAQGRLL